MEADLHAIVSSLHHLIISAQLTSAFLSRSARNNRFPTPTSSPSSIKPCAVSNTSIPQTFSIVISSQETSW